MVSIFADEILVVGEGDRAACVRKIFVDAVLRTFNERIKVRDCTS